MNQRFLLKTPEENDYKDEIVEIARLCKLAKMPEKLAEFVESGISLEEARDSLMKALASVKILGAQFQVLKNKRKAR